MGVDTATVIVCEDPAAPGGLPLRQRTGLSEGAGLRGKGVAVPAGTPGESGDGTHHADQRAPASASARPPGHRRGLRSRPGPGDPALDDHPLPLCALRRRNLRREDRSAGLAGRHRVLFRDLPQGRRSAARRDGRHGARPGRSRDRLLGGGRPPGPRLCDGGRCCCSPAGRSPRSGSTVSSGGPRSATPPREPSPSGPGSPSRASCARARSTRAPGAMPGSAPCSPPISACPPRCRICPRGPERHLPARRRPLPVDVGPGPPPPTRTRPPLGRCQWRPLSCGA